MESGQASVSRPMERFRRAVFAGDIRRRRVSRMRDHRHWRWRLDDMYAKLSGEIVHPWRAVDHEGEALESGSR